MRARVFFTRSLIGDDMIGDKRVGTAFFAERRSRAVPGDERHVITQGPQALPDRPQQRRVVTARKVGSSDRAVKQDIANEREPLFRVKENDMSRRMSRTMTNFEYLVTKAHGISVE